MLLYISLFVWLLPPLKQFRGRFFYYFLLQAISDPLVLILFMFKIPNLPIYLVKNLLLILLLWKPNEAVKKLLYVIPFLILVYITASMIHYTIINFIIAAAHVFILYFIFKLATADVIDLNKLKVFYIVIILYELSAILKHLFIIYSIHTGSVYYYLTTAFEILLGLFFFFIREDDKRIAIALNE